MSDCRKYYDFDWCYEDYGLFNPKPQTIADRIRNMTDEELAKIFALKRPGPPFAKWPTSCENGCGNCWLNWLQQEVE